MRDDDRMSPGTRYVVASFKRRQAEPYLTRLARDPTAARGEVVSQPAASTRPAPVAAVGARARNGAFMSVGSESRTSLAMVFAGSLGLYQPLQCSVDLVQLDLDNSRGIVSPVSGC
jgi:hypothetical protein